VAQASTGSGMPNLQLPNVTNMVSGAIVGEMIANGASLKPRTIIVGVIGLVVAIIVVSTVWMSVKTKLGLATPKGSLAYVALGIDPTHADPDQMIATVAEPAHRWAKDAVLWSVNFRNLKADGSINCESGGAVVTYASPSRATSLVKNDRKDAVKDFNFGRNGVGWDQIRSANPRWESAVGVHLGNCTIKKLVGVLKTSQGFTGDKVVSVDFLPQSRVFYDRDAWSVDSEDHSIKGVFAMNDCSLLKAGFH
ncbi:MAG: hypothetical protein ABI183_24980, partial [Polyangiaceae bacterium]